MAEPMYSAKHYAIKAQKQAQAAAESAASVDADKIKRICYEKSVDVLFNGDTTVNAQDNTEIIEVFVNETGTLTIDISQLTFPKKWATFYLRLAFENGYKPITLAINGLTESASVKWVSENVADFSDGKSHWLAFRVWSGKTYGLWSDMGTEG